jgi:hypothetical protein
MSDLDLLDFPSTDPRVFAKIRAAEAALAKLIDDTLAQRYDGVTFHRRLTLMDNLPYVIERCTWLATNFRWWTSEQAETLADFVRQANELLHPEPE